MDIFAPTYIHLQTHTVGHDLGKKGKGVLTSVCSDEK